MVNSTITFHLITESNIELLQNFLCLAGNSLSTFRYFASRPLTVINNHIITVVVTENNQPIGYGHLDKEEVTIWLGIAVCETSKGRGVGKQIMRYLINSAREKQIDIIDLTVDKINVSAIKLYKKFGFSEVVNNNETSLKMRLSLNDK